MKYIIYALSAISMFLAIGGFAAYSQTKHVGLLLSSIVSVVCALAAIALVSWWPLIIGLAANWGLRLLGLDPGARR
jgi:hypothetical protein